MGWQAWCYLWLLHQLSNEEGKDSLYPWCCLPTWNWKCVATNINFIRLVEGGFVSKSYDSNGFYLPVVSRSILLTCSSSMDPYCGLRYADYYSCCCSVLLKGFSVSSVLAHWLCAWLEQSLSNQSSCNIAIFCRMCLEKRPEIHIIFYPG